METPSFLDAWRIATAQNVATNGRWFCALLVLINLAATERALAVMAALPVGVSVLIEAAPAGRARTSAAQLLYVFVALVALATLIKAW